MGRADAKYVTFLLSQLYNKFTGKKNCVSDIIFLIFPVEWNTWGPGIATLKGYT